MIMLRRFAYHADFDTVLEVLRRFDIELPEYITLLRFEVITPDSFMWRLLIGDSIYYLYAEDYVPGLKHIEKVVNQYIERDNWSFLKPKELIQFEDATPVRGATTYQKADDTDEMMQYAIDSGHDFVFLVHSSEDAKNAQFSDFAPRGFTLES